MKRSFLGSSGAVQPSGDVATAAADALTADSEDFKGAVATTKPRTRTSDTITPLLATLAAELQPVPGNEPVPAGAKCNLGD
ncbi:hypothetical protein MNEG_0639, partial [Monoraphidium neglectum]